MEDQEIPLINWYTRNGDDVDAWPLEFDIDISGADFRFQSMAGNGFSKVGLTVGAGLTRINATNTLVFDSYKEERTPGIHDGWLKCIDQDGDRTIIRFRIKVEPMKVV